MIAPAQLAAIYSKLKNYFTFLSIQIPVALKSAVRESTVPWQRIASGEWLSVLLASPKLKHAEH